MKMSVCVLTFGDSLSQIGRWFNYLDKYPPAPYVQDVRIGVNVPTAQMTEFVNARAEQLSQQVPTIVYESSINTYKYPMMRKMFYDTEHPLAEYVMWFDDDSYIDSSDFWTAVEGKLPVTLMGQKWVRYKQGKQQEWLKTQKWYDKSRPDAEGFSFCQGAWWVANSAVLKQLDYPIPELKHCGGDALLGEMMSHAGHNMTSFDKGVRINADEYGRHSKAPRRGYSEKIIGADYKGIPLPTDHQNFEVIKRVYNQNTRNRAS